MTTTAHARPDVDPQPRSRAWARPMKIRSANDAHRASTPLELFFDLVFVVAISLNAAGLHHGIQEGHSSTAVISYFMQFSVIWWAWMGFTWCASRLDTDDAPYRLTVFLQMAGALAIAAGIPTAFETFDFTVIAIGYSIMRAGLVLMWLRAGRNNPEHWPAISRHVIGLVFCQALWIGLLFLPATWRLPLFCAFMLLECWVPIWAERGRRMPVHAEHITERYSLFTIIVLGESVLATVTSIKDSIGEHGISVRALSVILCALVILLSLWWLYFDKPRTPFEKGGAVDTFVWGYGHFFIFAAAAAIGVGFSVAVEQVNQAGQVPLSTAQWAIALPVAAFVLTLWAVHFPQMRHSPVAVVLFPAVSLLVLLTTALPGIALSMLAIALLCGGLLAAILALHYDAKPRAAH